MRKVIEVLTAFEALQVGIIPLGTYASLNIQADRTDDVAQMRAAEFSTAIGKISSSIAFVNSELLALDETILEQAAASSPLYNRYITQLLKQKPHQLHPEVENALPLCVLHSTHLMKFITRQSSWICISGSLRQMEKIIHLAMCYSKMIGNLKAIQRYVVQHSMPFLTSFVSIKHTTAKVYNTHIQQEKTIADLRGFDSVIDFLLFDQDVDRSLYNRQIDLITKELAPHMRRYAKLVQKAHGLDKMTFADLKISLDPSYDPKLTMAEAKDYVEKSLAVMGKDYEEMIERAFNERWIDYLLNKGKSTGAFCSSPYGSHPYILMSWNERMNEVLH
ncbi:Oligoendopeptidase F OS=Lysinibacillus sphaericus OX=1421 GN=LS41612_14430 PE=3 SV=1 [Lysinibacillus sphaericus]